ncbi:MAG: nitroreductase family protein [Spirochaetales bacterium]|nr:nitroreductase family protein [Spirochaetales bacterium]
MDFQKLVLHRYSTRSYKPDEIPAESLNAVLEAGRLAPTAANRQAFRIMVLRTKGAADRLLEIYRAEWFVQPPVVLAVVSLPRESWVRRDGKNYSDVDAAIVMDHMILAAADLGLGTCWIGAFDPDKAKTNLSLPDEAVPVAFTPLGYPADEPTAKKRKSLDDLVLYDRWK